MKRIVSFVIIMLFMFSMIPSASFASGGPVVLFTEDSEAVAGGKLTVDIEKMTDFDARIWNCFLERKVVYEWHRNDEIMLEHTSETLNLEASDVGACYYVLVACDDLVLKSDDFVIAAESDVPVITTETIYTAEVNVEYYCKLQCSDPTATYEIYYNPGKENEFDATGLELTQYGELTGTPAVAGEYTFSVCAAGKNGEGYAVFTLVVEGDAPTVSEESTDVTEAESSEVVSAVSQESEVSTSESADTTSEAEAVSADNTKSSDEASRDSKPQEDKKTEGLPVWLVAVIGGSAAILGALVAFLISRKKK